jgi:hypothetical protein
MSTACPRTRRSSYIFWSWSVPTSGPASKIDVRTRAAQARVTTAIMVNAAKLPRTSPRSTGAVTIAAAPTRRNVSIGRHFTSARRIDEELNRRGVLAWSGGEPPCLIGIEAGMATHYVARELAALGHDVKQVPPTYAKPFRQGHKNDFRDAQAVAEAVQRPTTRFVPGPVSPGQRADRSDQIKFAAFFSSAVSSSDKDCASFARRCLTSSPNGRMFFHHAWRESLLISPVTGASSMNELKP